MALQVALLVLQVVQQFNAGESQVALPTSNFQDISRLVRKHISYCIQYHVALTYGHRLQPHRHQLQRTRFVVRLVHNVAFEVSVTLSKPPIVGSDDLQAAATCNLHTAGSQVHRAATLHHTSMAPMLLTCCADTRANTPVCTVYVHHALAPLPGPGRHTWQMCPHPPQAALVTEMRPAGRCAHPARTRGHHSVLLWFSAMSSDLTCMGAQGGPAAAAITAFDRLNPSAPADFGLCYH